MNDNVFERPLELIWPPTTEILARQQAVIEATVGTSLPGSDRDGQARVEFEEMESWREKGESERKRRQLRQKRMGRRGLYS